MKVLFLASWYPTLTAPYAGVFVKEHAMAIHTASNEIVVLAVVVHRDKRYWKKTVTDNIDENGIRTVVVELFTAFFDVVYHAVPLLYLIAKKEFYKRIYPTFQPDIVHSNVVFPAGVIGHWLAKKLHKPHVITEHWSGMGKFMKKPLLSKWAKKAYTNAEAILPVSDFLKQNIISVVPKIDTTKLHVVGNVIDGRIFYYQEKNKKSEHIRLCAIAAWNRYKKTAKQPELFINAIDELPSEVKKNIELTIIGGGNMLAEMKMLCAEKEINATFTGYLDKPKIAEILRLSDFFIHASTIETFGVVVAEALMCGTPVICSNVGALPELIGAQNGVLCNNTVQEWVNGLTKAVQQHFDNKQIASDVSQKFSYLTIGKAINSAVLAQKH
jgi:glycosyltransferase involved in cell wall biosynthesis